MIFKTKIKTKEFIKICLFVICMGMVAIYSKSISSYLIDSYNNQIEYLASNMGKSGNMLMY